ncbi:tRNA lysidine(34) synthetase TilS [Caldicellulosiruptor naganoensis]|uniref:tRNA(Ile)-lysidine synthase n=1 Tax=Caldicellulosiruptor naganoensis TaxID=29324 RepID=A0ABY7BGU6_9FIRM|nr:tRNA lysidine(34) synthetase TilS [Caldicellulosiruptor naganoensis]WAM32052.1 tRNA lysidine(34) synthetase TilS [Caldicellulosiruptor naganoensis]
MDFLEKVRRTIDKHNMLKKGDKVLIGCSGGIDSMVLLDCIYRLKDEYELDITVAHLNHMLRQEAKEDELFVIDTCRRYNIKCVTRSVDVRKLKEEQKLSEEEAGRLARYNFFYELVKDLGLNRILLGHNKDDVVETFFLNLFRGSGLDGLASIPPVRDIVARPLIYMSRQEIEKYADKNGIRYVIDKTNFSSKYKRNVIRNEILPLVKAKFGDGVIDTIFRTINLIRDENLQINELVDDIFKRCVKKEDIYYVLDINEASTLPHFLQKRLVKKVFKEFEMQVSLDKVEDVLNLFSLPSGKMKIFGDLIVERQNDAVVFYKKVEKSDFCFEIPLKEEYDIKYRNFEFKFKITQSMEHENCIYVDSEKLFDGKIFFRTRRDGDFIQLKVGKKKLKEWFIDKKIPKRYRSSIPLLAKESEVIVIFDVYNNKVTINQSYKVTPQTKQFLEIKITILEGA